jgi:hypothetical protein
MTEMTQKFLDIFFNPGESICVSPSKYGYHSVSQEDLNKEICLISPKETIEPIMIQESDINLIALNPIIGFRRDSNVVAFRSFLIEIDTGSLGEQKAYIESFSPPYSVCIFSGNKSLHYGIVLEEDLPSIQHWRWVNQWLLNIFKQADQQVKNPSRSIRFPGNKRHDGKQLQQVMIESKGRIKNAEFFKWIGQYENVKPVRAQKTTTIDSFQGMPDSSKIPKDVMDKLNAGVTENRNETWFSIGWQIAKIGFSYEKTVQFLWPKFQEESDFKRREWETCLKSAFKRVRGEAYE